MIITVASTKGGVGKSTLSMHFTHALQLLYPDKGSVLMDADPQLTCKKWANWRSEANIEPYIEVQQLYADGMRKVLAAAEEHYEYVVIDVGGSDNPSLRRALSFSDVVVVPSSLDPAERLHTFDMMQLIDAVRQEYNSNLVVYLVFNNIRMTSERHYLESFKEGFAEYVQWLPIMVMQRVWYSRAYGQAKTVFDLVDKEEDSKAKAEIMGVVQAIVEGVSR